MYKQLVLLVMLMAACLLRAEPEKGEYTREQLDKLKAAEEKYKDNPAIMNIIEKTKNHAGLTEENEKLEAAESSATEPEFQGDAMVAEKAYAKKDYATAFANYKALAEAGDVDATLMLGIMYEQGHGTEKDPITAHAWYRKAADAGEISGSQLLRLVEKKKLSEEEIREADTRYETINKELAAAKKTMPEATDPLAATADQKIIYTLNRDLLAPGTNHKPSAPGTAASSAVFIPEKLYPAPHYQPEKFQRITP